MMQSDTTAKTIKVKLKTELPFWLVFLPLIFLTGILTKQVFIHSWPWMLGFTAIILSYSLLQFRLNAVQIDSNKRELTTVEVNVLGKQRIKKYPLNALQFTYKVGKTGFRSRLLNICTLYINNKEIVKIVPDYDGWTDESVNDLARELTVSGVEKRFIGRSFKDAEINGL